ncbi:D-tyrosyl-tRNA(Tyr) deacylase [Saccharicrinis carchari]|uniref:D-aminoacyl-tRNA deacylase n=1 Tax=Saccharicrinis carchari TaxID=1168039 RepID=A0A521CGZ1_SACCC|nr:D-aminoacyl-tRNA deacylase [Saccharicrinis carchari]SMO58698.1 D-tyrosyl-tRNA(Tyr) deacylase [Saccharicrinis carchari]
MKVVVQRVIEASVKITNTTTASIKNGLVVLVGISQSDEQDDIEWLCKKIVNLRIFDDEEGKMNRSLLDVNGEMIVVSQFTLQANTKKGNRPSYIQAAQPELALPLYQSFVKQMEQMLNKPVKTGEFGAHMQVSLTNDGPVTIIIDSSKK